MQLRYGARVSSMQHYDYESTDQTDIQENVYLKLTKQK